MWLTNPDLRHLIFSICTILLARPRPAAAQQDCIGTYDAVYEQPVLINTDVLSNTTFYPIPEVAVTVNNAPTSFNGITTFRYTQTLTSTFTLGASQSTTATLTTPTVALYDLNAFVLRISGAGAQQQESDRRKIHSKRQSGSSFVSANGTTSNDCTTSPIYAVNNGILTATSNGTVYYYSTSPGVPYQLFAPTTISGSINTTFSISGNGMLTWLNAAFYNGQASFCAVNNGTVYAVFQQNAQPDGCLFIELTLYSVSSCQALQYSTITGPPG